jgi:hypothetical protein
MAKTEKKAVETPIKNADMLKYCSSILQSYNKFKKSERFQCVKTVKIYALTREIV